MRNLREEGGADSTGSGKTDPQAAGTAQHTDADGRIHRNEKTH